MARLSSRPHPALRNDGLIKKNNNKINRGEKKRRENEIKKKNNKSPGILVAVDHVQYTFAAMTRPIIFDWSSDIGRAPLG